MLFWLELKKTLFAPVMLGFIALCIGLNVYGNAHHKGYHNSASHNRGVSIGKGAIEALDMNRAREEVPRIRVENFAPMSSRSKIYTILVVPAKTIVSAKMDSHREGLYT